MELADTSAWSWSRREGYPLLRQEFDSLVQEGEIAICDMTKLELLYSARDAAEFKELAEDLDALYYCPVEVGEWRRALWVYGELASRGGARQRAVNHADLLVAAAAEAASFPILHYDEDFERIAEITGQEIRWLAPRGSLR